MIPELGWPPCRRHGRGFRRATCGPLLRVAGNASSLESLQTAIVVLPLRPPGCSSHRSSVRECVRHSFPQLSPLRMAVCFVVSGHLSTQTGHDVWWSMLLLAEPVCSYPCSRKPAPSTSSAASGRCSRSPSCSSRAAPVALDTKSSLRVLCTLSP